MTTISEEFSIFHLVFTLEFLSCAAEVKVRVYSPAGKSDEGRFALDVAVKTLELYTK